MDPVRQVILVRQVSLVKQVRQVRFARQVSLVRQVRCHCLRWLGLVGQQRGVGLGRQYCFLALVEFVNLVRRVRQMVKRVRQMVRRVKHNIVRWVRWVRWVS